MDEELREELKEEIKKEMKEEQEEKKKNKKKGNNTWVIVILVILVLGLSGYIVYEKILEEKLDDRDEVTNNEIPDSNKSSESQVKELLNTYYFLNNDNYLFQKRLFEKGYDNFNKMYATWNSFSNDDFSSVVCSKLYSKSLYNEEFKWYDTENGVCSDESNPKSISYDKFDDKFEALFDDDAKKEGLGTSEGWFMLDYKTGKYIELSCGGCGWTTGPHIIVNSLKDYNETDDELVVNVYYQYIEASGEYGDSTDQYSFPLTGITINGTENYVYNQVTTRYMDLIDSYKIVFEKDDEKYIFESMSKN